MSEAKKVVLLIKKIDLRKWNPLRLFKKGDNRKWGKRVLWSVVVIGVLGIGTFIGAYKAILENLPSISLLEAFEPNIITYIYADDGTVIGEYAIEKRIEIPFEEIPEILLQAIIATEDSRFYQHHGIDFRGILRSLKEDVRLIMTPRKLHGGSTISQQLARELFLHRKQTLRRKLKEAILAFRIERNYSKQEILTFYCNQFNLGHGAYGVEAAAQLYFDKPASELKLEEAAMITGILQLPSFYSPYTNTERTLRRRNHVLDRMVEEGYIDDAQGEESKARPLNVLPLHRSDSDFAAHFKEEVRKYLYENYGRDSLYKEGLKVYTTLNVRYQEYAEAAVRKQLHILDKRQGWRDDKVNLVEKGLEELESIIQPIKHEETGESFFSSWRVSEIDVDDQIEALVLSVTKREAILRIGEYTGKLTNRDIAWTETDDLTRIIERGDIILVKILEKDEEKWELTAALDQEPKLDAAFLAIEPQTGQIKTMVGGYSFKRSEWNNATQATRQSGSVVKPMLYTAALENGFTPASPIIDELTDFADKWSGEIWDPPNYDHRYKGRITLRWGLEESRNIVTAKILDYISPQTGVNYVKKFGITSPIYPYLSLSLGAFEIKMIELVSAFTTFPNQGIRIHPYLITRIEDKEGNILEESKIESEEVISPQIAYIMTSLLQGVVLRGTAQAARFLDKPLGGKTGTTDDFSDAWFMGFSPSLCAGVWVGHREGRIPIGDRQSGAVAALPAWIDFFSHLIEDEKALAEENGEEVVQEEFIMPPNLSFAEIDRKTGLLATPFCLFPFKEVFIPGTEPNRFCSHEDHLMLLDYYSLIGK